MRLSPWASGLALLGASVLTGALVVSIDDGSASDGAVALAAAAQKIAFIGASTDPGGVKRLELYLINADGSGERRLVETARPMPATDQFELGSPPAWSPDGRKIAYAGMGDDGNVDVYVVGADGHGQQRLTRHPGVDGNPAWSPDGRKIAFTRRAREWGAGKTYIYVMNADGSGQRRLSHGHVHFSVDWSPDGQKMLFERMNPRHQGNEEIYVMNADGSGQRRLTRNRRRDLRPVWSPDGRQIAFMRGYDVWVMNPDGSGQRNLTPAGSQGNHPDWSPDGSKIAFSGRASTPPPGIFVMSADGSERRRLTQRGTLPAWSPDGQMIAFDRFVLGQPGSLGSLELYVVTADGRGERRLMRADGLPGAYHWAWSPAQK